MPPNRLEWRVATVREARDETPRARTLVLDVPDWPGHRAGQHVDVRLVAEDGYEAQRSYSIASAPEDPHVALTIERLENAEVSPYLCDVLQPGDGLEIRGPIGGWFVWEASLGGPLFLIAGGSGIVPLMSMLRHHWRVTPAAPRDDRRVRLLYSVRTLEDVIFREELERMAERPDVGVTFTLTREAPAGWAGLRRRIDRAMLEEVGWPPSATPRVYVCGPTPLVESVASLLVEGGHDPARIRTERFGPTG
ncbi:MAG TPA: ferredoxin reductase [Gemmatimonadaceae bacterium]|nr:ferredoxin reductase [Gemmatimonadaceae bacterium]